MQKADIDKMKKIAHEIIDSEVKKYNMKMEKNTQAECEVEYIWKV